MSAWATAMAEGSPRGGIPKPGGLKRTHGFELDVDFALMEAMDAWEAAFPGRAPYLTPRGEGEGKEAPDFRDRAPLPGAEDPLPPQPHQRSSGLTGGAQRKVAGLLKALGLDRASGSGSGSGQSPGYHPEQSVQGMEAIFDMSLVRPVMKVITERAGPMLSKGGTSAPDKPGERVGEEQIEVDPQKLDHVIEAVYERIWDFMDLEKQRRGW